MLNTERVGRLTTLPILRVLLGIVSHYSSYPKDSSRDSSKYLLRILPRIVLWMPTVPMLNINEKTASDLADTADRADATDITDFCYIVFFLFFVRCGGRRHAHNINATPVTFSNHLR